MLRSAIVILRLRLYDQYLGSTFIYFYSIMHFLLRAFRIYTTINNNIINNVNTARFVVKPEVLLFLATDWNVLSVHSIHFHFVHSEVSIDFPDPPGVWTINPEGVKPSKAIYRQKVQRLYMYTVSHIDRWPPTRFCNNYSKSMSNFKNITTDIISNL